MILSLLLSAIIWSLYFTLGAILYILGFLIVPIALYFDVPGIGQYMRPSKYFESKSVRAINNPFLAFLIVPWFNEEDGLYPDNFAHQTLSWSPFRRAFTWLCLRNPVSGLRWAPFISTLIKPTKIQYVGSFGPAPEMRPSYEVKVPNWFYIWQGPFRSCFWAQFKVGSKLYRLWVGNFKGYPADLNGPPYGYRQYGTDGVLQLKEVQMGENKN